MCVCVRVCTYLNGRACAFACVRACVRACTYPNGRACVFACVRACVRACVYVPNHPFRLGIGDSVVPRDSQGAIMQTVHRTEDFYFFTRNVEYQRVDDAANVNKDK